VRLIRRFTLDTGALVAIERRKQRAMQLFELLGTGYAIATVPAPVLSEWWRGRTDVREKILLAVDVEPLSMRIACLAGEALAKLGKVKAGLTIDAQVMASAALRGDVVYTGDAVDLERLRAFFPGVRVLAV
jgi:predicted nucleic acid-binding protein